MLGGLQLGEEMLAEEHGSSQQIRRRCSLLSSRWRILEEKMSDRGDKLRQAGQQEQLMELLQVRLTEEKHLGFVAAELLTGVAPPI